MRLQDRPTFRASDRSPSRTSSPARAPCEPSARRVCIRRTAACSIPAKRERPARGAGDDAVLLLAFESADHSLDAWMSRALECAADHGGSFPPDAGRTRTEGRSTRREAERRAPGGNRSSALPICATRSSAWACSARRSRRRSPGIASRAFTRGDGGTEDAVKRVCGSRSRHRPLHARLSRRTGALLHDPRPEPAVEPDRAMGRDQAAASDCLMRLGGTITHHHAVGRDHRPWYDGERPDGFARALRCRQA